jgi:hypothetical protein
MVGRVTQVNRYLSEGNPYLGGIDPRRQAKLKEKPVKEWEIEQSDHGSCDVRLDRRAVSYGLDDLHEAAELIHRRDPQVRRVTVVDPDGYRHDEHLSDLY